jgi:hypothetical protein
MNTAWWLTAAASLSAAGCVSPVDYGDPRVDAGDRFSADGPELPCGPIEGPDEDGDGCWDKRDMCPTVPEGRQLDTDGDLVGDACDPQPGLANKQLLYAGFDGNEAATSWREDGQWNLNHNDSVFEGNLIDEEGGVYYVYNPLDPLVTGPVRMTAIISLDLVGPDAEVAVIVGYGPDQPRGNTCFVRRPSGDDPAMLGAGPMLDGIRDAATIPLAESVLYEGQRFELEIEQGFDYIERAPAGTRCTYRTGGRTNTVEHKNARYFQGTLRIDAEDVVLRVESLVVYQLTTKWLPPP